MESTHAEKTLPEKCGSFEEVAAAAAAKAIKSRSDKGLQDKVYEAEVPKHKPVPCDSAKTLYQSPVFGGVPVFPVLDEETKKRLELKKKGS